MTLRTTDPQSVIVLIWTIAMTIRPLELKQDFAAVRRIWEEIGWIDRNDDDDAKYLRKFLKGSRTLTA